MIETQPLPVETLEWMPRWSYWGIAENFARVQILLTVFDGEPDKWLSMIDSTGTAADEADRPFLLDVRRRLSDDPTLLADLRRLVNEFASCFSRARAS